MCHWNGLSILRDPSTAPPTQITIQTDTSGSWGCGAVHGHLWLQLRWSGEWACQDIMAKELVPVVLMMAVSGPLLARQNVLIQCDNLSLVTSIKKGTAKLPLVMHLLCSLWFFTSHYDTALMATNMWGVTNTAADKLSRNQLPLFHLTNPRVSMLPTPIPTSLQKSFLHVDQIGLHQSSESFLRTPC